MLVLLAIIVLEMVCDINVDVLRMTLVARTYQVNIPMDWLWNAVLVLTVGYAVMAERNLVQMAYMQISVGIRYQSVCMSHVIN